MWNLVLLLLLALGSPAPQDTAKALKDFGRAFRSNPKRPKPVARRLEALETLQDHHGIAVAETLVEAHADVEKEVLALEEERTRLLEQLVSMVKGQEFGTRTFDTATMASYKGMQSRAARLAEKAEDLRGLQRQVTSRLREEDEQAVTVWLIEHVVGKPKLPLSLRIAVLERASEVGEEVTQPLVKAFGRTRKAEELMLLLEVFARIGEDARAAAPRAIELLEHADVSVRERAAFALATLATADAIEPLIDRLAAEDGITQKRVAAALETLTRQKHGTSVATWRRWLAEDGQRFLNGEEPLGSGFSGLVAASMTVQGKKADSYYYGIPQEGRSMVYVIDCSGSMVVSATDPKYQGNQPVNAGKESRMEACKTALIKALQTLKKDQEFNILFFNDLPYLYSEKMVKANKGEIEKACNWVFKLQASSTTNIHDALERGFAFAGRGARDRYYGLAADIIFLLTDGTPTTTEGQPDSTERIHEAVKRWNPYRRVVIHTIGIGKQVNRTFLERLARDNGGRFVSH